MISYYLPYVLRALMFTLSQWIVQILQVFEGMSSWYHTEKREAKVPSGYLLRLEPTKKYTYCLWRKETGLWSFITIDLCYLNARSLKVAFQASIILWQKINRSALQTFTNLKALSICRIKGHHLLKNRLRKRVCPFQPIFSFFDHV